MKVRMRIAASLRRFILSALGIGLLAGFARADLIVNIPAAQDVTLFGGSDATNNDTSSGPGMFVGSDPSNPKRGIIEFNVPAYVPAGATITSATLTLYLGQVAGSGGGTGSGDSTPRTIRLFDVTRAWNGSTLGTTGHAGPGFGGTGHGFTPPNTGDATWNYAMFSSVPWTTPGGDFSATESADAVVSQTVNSPYSWTSPQMALDVQNWLNGTLPNYGWLLKNDSESLSQTFRAFYTREGAVVQSVPQFAPNLAVSYTVPEPASALVAVIGMSALLCRRRQQFPWRAP